MLVFKSRVKETSTTSGTGSYTLTGAVSGFRAFSVIGAGNQTPYVATDGTNWEAGIGTVGSSSLTRDTIESSSTGSKINWGGGTITIFATEVPEIGAALYDPISKINMAASFR